ncbi:MAG: IS1595 family transposase [Proteobacteria bacterium]|nr:IS1595 family transposase [Pseudomonadota bacterium]
MSKIQNQSTKGDTPIQDLPTACANEAVAVEFMEKNRWGDYPACPKCGGMDVYQMQSRKGGREKHYRWRCRDCNSLYSVRTGTVFEDSRIPLRHWCFGFWRAATSKKGVSALEIKRQTGLSYKSALFLLHRIRFAMAPTDGNPLTGTVEIDETHVGGKPRHPRDKREAWSNKTPVMAMVERGGRVRAMVLPDVSAKTLKIAIRDNVDRRAKIMTDEAKQYRGIGREYEGGHHTVKHSAGEYVRGDVTTNTVESYFAIVKRGLSGIYHSVSKKHLHRYLAEYEFRYNGRKLSDGDRTVAAIQAADGKRLRYREPVDTRTNFRPKQLNPDF